MKVVYDVTSHRISLVNNLNNDGGSHYLSLHTFSEYFVNLYFLRYQPHSLEVSTPVFPVIN